jgi:hypothetical protein
VQLEERFTGTRLDPDVWLPYYLPHWSSRARSRATHEVRDGALRLSIPADQGLWCEGVHETPLRVSVIASGEFAGAQAFRPGLAVAEEQPAFWGYTPDGGHIEIRCRGVVTARSMFAFWLSGIEDRPERSGEICVMEIFGDAVRDGSADVGIGVKKLGDPKLTQEFSADPLPIDPAEFHTYAVDWRPGSLEFAVDGEIVKRCAQAPDYQVQLMIGVFDFPDRAAEVPGPVPVPEMVVSHVIGHPL